MQPNVPKRNWPDKPGQIHYFACHGLSVRYDGLYWTKIWSNRIEFNAMLYCRPAASPQWTVSAIMCISRLCPSSNPNVFHSGFLDTYFSARCAVHQFIYNSYLTSSIDLRAHAARGAWPTCLYQALSVAKSLGERNMQCQLIIKAVNTMMWKVVHCPYCSATNCAVKKVGPLKTIHDKSRAKTNCSGPRSL
jgi:hypothetical protein